MGASLDPMLREAMLAEIDRELSRRRLELYTPYHKQQEFHALGASTRERLFMAGNQLGKSLSGAAEMAIHLTGRYPDWWDGRVFTKPPVAWASGVTGESVRDTVQRLLVGRPGQYGTGFIPADCIVGEPRRAMGVADLLDSVAVRHSSGGESRLYFKRYEQGREKWQGETLDIVWFDEEPPSDIYTEGLTRTNATGGMAYMTFTPLLGMSEVVTRFITEASPDRSVTNMTIDDVDHYSDEEKRRIIESYPAHEREARAKGIPTLGSGRIFPVEEGAIKVAPFAIPAHWPRINGLDFGWDHPTAAVQLAWDRDADCIYVHKAHRMREATPVIHAATVKAWGAWVPTAWPHDGLQHDKGSGEQLAKQYASAGLLMLKDRATFEDGSNGVEAGLMDMLERMQTGRWKVFSNLDEWFQEFRLYHRKDGKVVKVMDDLMCLHPDTEVITDSGVRRITDLVGETGKVLSVDGVWADFHECRMTRKNAEVLKVTFSDGFELICTPDHKLLTDAGEWVQAVDSVGIKCHDSISRSKGAAWKKFGWRPRKAATTLSVLRIESAGRSDVFCMEVPDFHAFAIANGAVVHNCASRYALMMKRKAKTRPIETTRDAAWVPLDKEIGW